MRILAGILIGENLKLWAHLMQRMPRVVSLGVHGRVGAHRWDQQSGYLVAMVDRIPQRELVGGHRQTSDLVDWHVLLAGRHCDNRFLHVPSSLGNYARVSYGPVADPRGPSAPSLVQVYVQVPIYRLTLLLLPTCHSGRCSGRCP